jgi:hypothetical protein
MKHWGNKDFKEAVNEKITRPVDKDQALVEALRAIAIALVYLAEQVRYGR